VSDWGGLNSAVDSIRATTDLEMPGPPLRYGEALKGAVELGDVSESQHVDLSVRRLLHLLEQFKCLGKSTPVNGNDSEHAAISDITA
jgi:beta-glucosidase